MSRKKKDIVIGKYDVLFSKVTEIYYIIINKVLFKYPAYGVAEKKWIESAYRGTFNHMTKINSSELEVLKEHMSKNFALGLARR